MRGSSVGRLHIPPVGLRSNDSNLQTLRRVHDNGQYLPSSVVDVLASLPRRNTRCAAGFQDDTISGPASTSGSFTGVHILVGGCILLHACAGNYAGFVFCAACVFHARLRNSHITGCNFVDACKYLCATCRMKAFEFLTKFQASCRWHWGSLGGFS